MQANAPQSRRIRLNFTQSSGCLTFVGIMADATAKHGSDWRILSLGRYQEPLSAKIVSLRKLLLTYESALLDRFFDLWKKILKIVPHNVYHYQPTSRNLPKSTGSEVTWYVFRSPAKFEDGACSVYVCSSL